MGRPLRDYVNKYFLREKKQEKDGLSGYQHAKDVIDDLEEGMEEDKLEDEIVDMTKEKKLKKNQTDIWSSGGKKIAGAKERKEKYHVDDVGIDPRTYMKNLGLSEVRQLVESDCPSSSEKKKELDEVESAGKFDKKDMEIIMQIVLYSLNDDPLDRQGISWGLKVSASYLDQLKEKIESVASYDADVTRR